jgi:heptosyltransferase II
LKIAELEKGASLLLRLPNWVGDVVMTTPSIQAIRRERPDLEITLAVRKHLLPLVEDYPGIRNEIGIEGKELGSNYELLKEIRTRGFSALIIFAKGFREGLIAGLSKIPVTIGFNVNLRQLFLTHPVEMTEDLWNRHHSLQFAALLEPLGIALKDDKPFLPVREKDLDAAGKILATSGLEKNKFIAFHIGASKFPRAYHSERFAEAAKIVRAKTGIEIALIGTDEDKSYISSFMSVCDECRDLSGKIDLKTLPAFLSLSLLFVGNDSGPMHLASAVGTPIAAVFGPGSPEKTAPLLPAEKMRIIYEGLPCSPCRQSFFKDCSPSANGKPPCLELISHEVLAGQILDLIKKLNF